MQEKAVQPCGGPAVGLVGLVRWAPTVMMSFTLLSRTWLQEFTEVESVGEGPGACGSMKAGLRFFSTSRVAPWRPRSDPLVPPWTEVLEEHAVTAQDLQVPWSSVLPRLGPPFLPRFSGRWPTLQSRVVLVVREAQREVGAGGGGCTWTRCPGRLRLWEQFSGLWELTGSRDKEPSSANGVGWVPEAKDSWLVPRFPLEKRLEGSRRLEEGASLRLFCPSTVEGETHSRCCPAHCFDSNSDSAFHGNGVTLSHFPFLRLKMQSSSLPPSLPVFLLSTLQAVSQCLLSSYYIQT